MSPQPSTVPSASGARLIHDFIFQALFTAPAPGRVGTDRRGGGPRPWSNCRATRRSPTRSGAAYRVVRVQRHSYQGLRRHGWGTIGKEARPQGLFTSLPAQPRWYRRCTETLGALLTTAARGDASSVMAERQAFARTPRRATPSTRFEQTNRGVARPEPQSRRLSADGASGAAGAALPGHARASVAPLAAGCLGPGAGSPSLCCCRSPSSSCQKNLVALVEERERLLKRMGLELKSGGTRHPRIWLGCRPAPDRSGPPLTQVFAAGRERI